MQGLRQAVEDFDGAQSEFRHSAKRIYNELYAIFPEKRKFILTTNMYGPEPDVKLEDGMVVLEIDDYCRGQFMGHYQDEFPMEWLWTEEWREQEKEEKCHFMEKQRQKQEAEAERERQKELETLATLKEKYEPME